MNILYFNVKITVFIKKRASCRMPKKISKYNHTTLNALCFTGFLLTYACAFLNASIFLSSSVASSKPRCVYTFIVTPISECPIRYCSVFGFMPDLAILLQYYHSFFQLIGSIRTQASKFEICYVHNGNITLQVFIQVDDHP